MLGLQVSQPRSVRGLHATKIGAQLIEREVAKVDAAAKLFDGHAGYRLLEESDYLLIGKSSTYPQFSEICGLTAVTLVRLAEGRSTEVFKPVAPDVTSRDKVPTCNWFTLRQRFARLSYPTLTIDLSSLPRFGCHPTLSTVRLTLQQTLTVSSFELERSSAQQSLRC